MANPSDITVQMIENAFRTNKAQSMLLGGTAGSGGGSGGPPGGFIGKLPQTKVTYDLSELASSGIPASGVSLLDNLNHIRYRIEVLETASGGGGGGHVIEDISTAFPQRTNLKFLGGVTVVDNSGDDSTEITISGGSTTLTGYMQKSVYDSDLDGVVDNSELLNNHADTYFQTALGFTPEDAANKTNDTTLTGDSATLYPTEHAVKTYVDNAAISGIAFSGLYGHQIKDISTSYTQRNGLRFVGSGVSVSDDSGNDNTIITISGGSGGVSGEEDTGIPSTIRNLVLWIDAGKIEGLSDGNAITNQILDRSGRKTQIATVASPLYKTNIINSLPIIRLNGSSQYLVAQFPYLISNFALLVIFKMTSITPAYSSLIASSYGDAGGYFIKSNGKSAEYRGANNYDGSGAASFDTTNWNYIVTNHKTSTFDTRKNGVADKTGTTDASWIAQTFGEFILIGAHTTAGRFVSGDIAEVIGYSRELTSTEISTLESYVQGKYGL